MDRLERMEAKVDKLQENVSELHLDFKIHLKVIEEHVAGDQKIISEIQPLIQQFKYEQEQKVRAYKYLKVTGVITAIITGIISVIHKFSNFH